MTPRNKSATVMRATPETRRTGCVTDGHATPALIEAIKNSTTGKDQIVLRRLGLPDEPLKESTQSRQADNANPR